MILDVSNIADLQTTSELAVRFGAAYGTVDVLFAQDGDQRQVR